MTTSEGFKNRGDKAFHKLLMKKSEELIAEAAKYAKLGEAIWTITYLRSAITVAQAARELR